MKKKKMSMDQNNQNNADSTAISEQQNPVSVDEDLLYLQVEVNIKMFKSAKNPQSLDVSITCKDKETFIIALWDKVQNYCINVAETEANTPDNGTPSTSTKWRVSSRPKTRDIIDQFCRLEAISGKRQATFDGSS